MENGLILQNIHNSSIFVHMIETVTPPFHSEYHKLQMRNWALADKYVYNALLPEVINESTYYRQSK